MARKKKKAAGINLNGWIATWSDMVSLMLCFFVIMYDPDTPAAADLQAMAASMDAATGGMGVGSSTGGLTLSQGALADLGNTIMSLPSMDRGRFLGQALRRAVSMFNPEVRSNMVKITQDERGLIISFAADAFFNPASARVNIESTRDILNRLAQLLNSNEVGGKKIRIEGHTDSVDVDPTVWQDNWQLSSERSRAVLRYLVDFGVDEQRFQVAGFADTMPIVSNLTEEGRAYNRRVDIVIIDDGHL